MRSGRVSNRGGWVAWMLVAVLWWSVPASGGNVLELQSPQQGSQPGSQPCKTGQTKQGANGSSSNKANGANNGCGAKPAKKPAPLFGGSLSIKKSTQSTDSTALGFNGVDPNGQVQQALLNASPGPDSQKKVQAMASYRPSAAELAEFQREGGLTSSSPVVKPGQEK
ncbi:MAG TPA: hypothetical protein VIJ65_05285 [Acidobacteriaceae bacterium]